MVKRRKKRQLLLKKLFNKRRLVILNEDTFEETFSLKLKDVSVLVGMKILHHSVLHHSA